MEILKFAIEMELDGERYYREQAEKNRDNALHTVFMSLADDEAKHAALIQKKMDNVPYALTGQEALTRRMDLFRQEKDFHIKVKALPDQPELYHAALDKEKQSIDLYSDLRAKATDDQAKALFDFLIAEETTHKNILDELFAHVNRPNSWVEAAEFGVREEY